MPEKGQISIRPRLTFFEDIHPELFEIFERIPESRYNAMVMQMMVKMATIEKYGGSFMNQSMPSSEPAPLKENKPILNKVKPLNQGEKQVTHAVQEQKEAVGADQEASSTEGVTSNLLEALGDMSFG